jgi:multidrug efflux pump subunit AcrA (membrane-fusion protein)
MLLRSKGSVRANSCLASTVAGSLLVLAGALTLSGCQKAEAEKAKAKPTEVSVENPVRELVTEHEEFTGRLVAVEAVDVRARVSGYLDEVFFKDGEDVRAGQPLFKIDPRPYQA